MDSWKRMIPGVTGASLALGGIGCGGSDSHPASINTIANRFCSFEQTCDAAYFNYANLAECVQAYTTDWNTNMVPDLQALGGNGCVDAYTSFYDCYSKLLNNQTCVDPTNAIIEASCGASYAHVLDACTNPGGNGTQIEAIATAFCQDYQACEPTYFGYYYSSLADCVGERRQRLSEQIVGQSAGCMTGVLAWRQCQVDAYSASSCTSPAGSCSTEYASAETACGGTVPFAVAQSVNKDRSGGESHRPRWLRSRR